MIVWSRVALASVLACCVAAGLSSCAPSDTADSAPTQASAEATPAASPESESADLRPLFPADNIWNTPVGDMPVHEHSDLWVETIGQDVPLHPDFGSGEWEGETIGIPYMIVGADTPRVEVSFYYPEESDPGPYPIPEDPLIEGGPDAYGDRHILLLDEDAHMLYELYDAWPQDDGTWEAGAGAIWDLTSNELRPETWTSADAAGLPILPGLVDYDEVASGRIEHALRFTAEETAMAYLWPARHYASELVGDGYPPMGARFRLKQDVEISGYSPEVQVVLQALKEYGMILADNGASWFLSGTSDERWDNDVMFEMKHGGITGDDFEAVDCSSLMVDPDSGQARSE